MNFLRKCMAVVALPLNVLGVAALVFTAYSSHADPVAHPLVACAGLLFPFCLLLCVLFLLFWLVMGPRRYLLVSAIGLLLCLGPIRHFFPINLERPQPPKGSIKLLTYNVMKGNAGLQSRIGPYLQQSGADIVCLQEFAPRGKGERNFLPDYPYRHTDGRKSQNACFSKYPIVETRRIPYDTGSGNGSMAYRIACGTDTLWVVNVHLATNRLSAADLQTYKEMVKKHHRSQLESGVPRLVGKLCRAVVVRAEQTRCVKKFVQQLDTDKLVVCGDFNDSPLSYAYRQLSDGLGLRDAFVASGNGMGVSYNRHAFLFRIDHILAGSALKSYRCHADHSIDSSDHYPVSCYLSVP